MGHGGRGNGGRTGTTPQHRLVGLALGTLAAVAFVVEKERAAATAAAAGRPPSIVLAAAVNMVVCSLNVLCGCCTMIGCKISAWQPCGKCAFQLSATPNRSKQCPSKARPWPQCRILPILLVVAFLLFSVTRARPRREQQQAKSARSEELPSSSEQGRQGEPGAAPRPTPRAWQVIRSARARQRHLKRPACSPGTRRSERGGGE